MATSYSIRSVSRITGLTQERIRSWEHRHGVVAPDRTETGRRSYSDDDVRRLQLLAEATALGHGISEIAGLTEAALRSLTEPANHSDDRADTGRLVKRMIGDLKRMELGGCDRSLTAALLNLDPWQAIEEVVAPLLHTVGALWQRGELSVGHEHMISNLVRMRLYGCLQTTGMLPNRSLILFTTVCGERHELGALAACYLARAAGVRGEYLGADLPAGDIVDLVKGLRCDVLGISVTNPVEENDAVTTIGEIRKNLPGDVRIWLGGRYARDADAALGPDDCLVIDSGAAYRRHLAAL